ncbi:hypothetical protein MHU86_1592 [Fragilaria crotonensis]|nr:hypothetical protein MHU86_1592 [Fragilaria crotonensis]
MKGIKVRPATPLDLMEETGADNQGCRATLSSLLRDNVDGSSRVSSFSCILNTSDERSISLSEIENLPFDGKSGTGTPIDQIFRDQFHAMHSDPDYRVSSHTSYLEGQSTRMDSERSHSCTSLTYDDIRGLSDSQGDRRVSSDSSGWGVTYLESLAARAVAMQNSSSLGSMMDLKSQSSPANSLTTATFAACDAASAVVESTKSNIIAHDAKPLIESFQGRHAVDAKGTKVVTGSNQTILDTNIKVEVDRIAELRNAGMAGVSDVIECRKLQWAHEVCPILRAIGVCLVTVLVGGNVLESLAARAVAMQNSSSLGSMMDLKSQSSPANSLTTATFAACDAASAVVESTKSNIIVHDAKPLIESFQGRHAVDAKGTEVVTGSNQTILDTNIKVEVDRIAELRNAGMAGVSDVIECRKLQWAHDSDNVDGSSRVSSFSCILTTSDERSISLSEIENLPFDGKSGTGTPIDQIFRDQFHAMHSDPDYRVSSHTSYLEGQSTRMDSERSHSCTSLTYDAIRGLSDSQGDRRVSSDSSGWGVTYLESLAARAVAMQNSSSLGSMMDLKSQSSPANSLTTATFAACDAASAVVESTKSNIIVHDAKPLIESFQGRHAVDAKGTEVVTGSNQTILDTNIKVEVDRIAELRNAGMAGVSDVIECRKLQWAHDSDNVDGSSRVSSFSCILTTSDERSISLSEIENLPFDGKSGTGTPIDQIFRDQFHAMHSDPDYRVSSHTSYLEGQSTRMDSERSHSCTSLTYDAIRGLSDSQGDRRVSSDSSGWGVTYLESLAARAVAMQNSSSLGSMMDLKSQSSPANSLTTATFAACDAASAVVESTKSNIIDSKGKSNSKKKRRNTSDDNDNKERKQRSKRILKDSEKSPSKQSSEAKLAPAMTAAAVGQRQVPNLRLHDTNETTSNRNNNLNNKSTLGTANGKDNSTESIKSTIMAYAENCKRKQAEKKARKKLDAQIKKPRIIREPEIKQYFKKTPQDIIFGRGTVCNRHNENFRENQVAPRYLDYREGYDAEKTAIVRELVDWVKNQGGRFLLKDADGWYEVTEEAAMLKVRTMVREYSPAVEDEH